MLVDMTKICCHFDRRETEWRNLSCYYILIVLDVSTLVDMTELPTKDYPLPTKDYSLPTTDYPLQTTHYPLPTKNLPINLIIFQHRQIVIIPAWCDLSIFNRIDHSTFRFYGMRAIMVFTQGL